jgi:hypothetical protein
MFLWLFFGIYIYLTHLDKSLRSKVAPILESNFSQSNPAEANTAKPPRIAENNMFAMVILMKRGK